jgi:MinD superfamily P-loop ATPase
MKIAVTSTGNSLDSEVDARFGRAAYFLVVDTETMDFECIGDEALSASGGAGISAAKTVVDSGAKAVLTGNCGPNAARTLSAAGVKLYAGVSGAVKDAIEAANMRAGFRIAIASGKGGTGKTTIATNLCKAAAEQGAAVEYIDCDVEEPNGHIFLKPRIESKKDVTVSVPQVDKDKCSGCGKCGQVCQYGAIVHLGGKNVLTFENLCHSCGGCWLLCPEQAIRQQQIKIGQVEFGNVGRVGFAQGILSIGSVRSVSLIRHLKQAVDSQGLVIFDVPPGTSCPVVESLKGADYVLLVTEPTPFGLHDLKCAVELVRKMDLDFGVVINRDGCGDDKVQKYCESEGIEILMRIKDDRRIAQAYSAGEIIVEVLPEYKEAFAHFYESLSKRLKGQER